MSEQGRTEHSNRSDRRSVGGFARDAVDAGRGGRGEYSAVMMTAEAAVERSIATRPINPANPARATTRTTYTSLQSTYTVSIRTYRGLGQLRGVEQVHEVAADHSVGRLEGVQLAQAQRLQGLHGRALQLQCRHG